MEKVIRTKFSVHVQVKKNVLLPSNLFLFLVLSAPDSNRKQDFRQYCLEICKHFCFSLVLTESQEVYRCISLYVLICLRAIYCFNPGPAEPRYILSLQTV